MRFEPGNIGQPHNALGHTSLTKKLKRDNPPLKEVDANCKTVATGVFVKAII